MSLFFLGQPVANAQSTKSHGVDNTPRSIQRYYQKTLQQRKKILFRYLKAGGWVASKVRNRKILPYVNMLNYGNLCVPHVRGVLQVVKPKTRKHFCLAPVLSSDKRFGREWASFVDKKDISAYYSFAHNTLMLREHAGFSKAISGIMLIHELVHAHTDLMRYNDSQPTEADYRRKDEVRARNVEQLLMLAIGGRFYRELLEQEMHIILQWHRRNNPHLFMYIPRKTYPINFNMVPNIGEAITVEERTLRSTILRLHAYFQIFKKKYTGTRLNKLLVQIVPTAGCNL